MSWRNPEGESKRRSHGWGAVVVVVVVAALVGAGIYLYSRAGSAEPRSRRIENRTDQVLYLYLRDAQGSEDSFDLAPKLGPRSSVVVYGCGAGEWVARTRQGTLVARRGPFEDCSAEPWIIEATPVSEPA
jgi:hypothetical protein